MRRERRAQLLAQKRFDVAVERRDRVVLLFALELERDGAPECLERNLARRLREQNGRLFKLLETHASKTPIAR